MAANEDYLGQPIVIINKPGAGGRAGWNWFASVAEDDGYTLSAYNIPHVIAQSIKRGVNNLSDAYRAQSAGNVKILVVADVEWNTELSPDIPTLREAGLDVDNSLVNGRGLMVPKGSSPEIIAMRAERVPAMFGDESMAKQVAADGSSMKIMNLAEV